MGLVGIVAVCPVFIMYPFILGAWIPKLQSRQELMELPLSSQCSRFLCARDSRMLTRTARSARGHGWEPTAKGMLLADRFWPGSSAPSSPAGVHSLILGADALFVSISAREGQAPSGLPPAVGPCLFFSPPFHVCWVLVLWLSSATETTPSPSLPRAAGRPGLTGPGPGVSATVNKAAGGPLSSPLCLGRPCVPQGARARTPGAPCCRD